MSSKREPTLKQHARYIWDMSTDGCSAAPDLNIRACCEDHDFHYRNGTVSRSEADALLRYCISNQGIGKWRYKILPWLYWLGVRFGGWKNAYRYDRRIAYLKTRQGVNEDAGSYI